MYFLSRYKSPHRRVVLLLLPPLFRFFFDTAKAPSQAQLSRDGHMRPRSRSLSLPGPSFVQSQHAHSFKPKEMWLTSKNIYCSPPWKYPRDDDCYRCMHATTTVTAIHVVLLAGSKTGPSAKSYDVWGRRKNQKGNERLKTEKGEGKRAESGSRGCILTWHETAYMRINATYVCAFLVEVICLTTKQLV